MNRESPSQIPLYSLGLLLHLGPQHGYQLRKILASQLADFVDIKLPTVYYHLARMEAEGLVSGRKENASEQMEKTVYSITPKGKQLFERLLTRAIESPYRPFFSLDAGFYFVSFLESPRLRSALREHIETLEKRLKALSSHRKKQLEGVPKAYRQAASLIFSHHEYHYQAELEWARQARAVLAGKKKA